MKRDILRVDELGIRLELAALLEERLLSHAERRRQRLNAAFARVRAAGGTLADAIGKARRGEAISEDEFIIVNLGFLPGEREWLEEQQE